MAREVFGPGIFREEGRTIEQIDKKCKKGTGSGTSDWWEEEKQEQEDLKRLHEEAAVKYEEALGVPPPEDWTTEQITAAMEEEVEREKLKRSEAAGRDASGLRGPLYKTRQFNKAQGVVERGVRQRGQRSGRKRPKYGRETIGKKEAA